MSMNPIYTNVSPYQRNGTSREAIDEVELIPALTELIASRTQSMNRGSRTIRVRIRRLEVIVLATATNEASMHGGAR